MVLATKQFIISSAVVVLGSLALGAILTAPSPLDAVFAYENPDISEVQYSFATKTPMVTSSASEAAVILDPQPQEDATEAFESAGIGEAAGTPVYDQQAGTVSVQVPLVPFYSQFSDISSPAWKKVGCGIASLAMLIEYYDPGTVSVDTLLQEGIDANAYMDTAGWTYAGLIGISKEYGLRGETRDHGSLAMDGAYEKLLASLTGGPVMASVHYTFQKSNPIPHLVVINGIKDGSVFYNDPAQEEGGGSISVEQFKSAWKKRYIEFRPL